MKKVLKRIGIGLGIILLLLIVVVLFTANKFKSTFLDFEDDFVEKTEFSDIEVDGQLFVDRNGNGTLDPYEDHRLSLEERVSNALSLMNQEEKIHLLKGSGLASAMGQVEPGTGIPGAVGTIVPTPRLGLPTIYLSDGPAGLRIQPTREGEERTYYCTAFPIGTLMASTWNTALAQEVGQAMGKEGKEYGIDVILGPAANIMRHPFCGRNFEYYSEDPLLSGKIGAAVVNGIESNGVGTAVKHFLANNQETNRNLNDVRISERALREIYLKGFEIMVEESQPWTIMSSYNKINGTYVAEDRRILTDILRDEWGFEGLVMTDWFGGYDPVNMIMAGNDLLEPGTNKQWKALKAGAEEGTLSSEAIDTSVRRILRLVFTSHKMKGTVYSNDPDLKAHAVLTRQSAAEGMVLLKNESVLPLTNQNNIALIGVTSFDFIAGGTGSGDVNEAYSISLEQGLENAGFTVNDYSKEVFEKHKAENKEGFQKPEGMDAIFNPYMPPQLTYTAEDLVKMAETAEAAVITIGRNSGEGGDRLPEGDYLLTEAEKQMIANTCEAFHAKNKAVIVVLNIGGVIETASWNEAPDAILLAWQGGQEGGNSVADILKGAVNPSGKLPMTFPVKLEDHASHANFPMVGTQWSLPGMLMGLMQGPPETKPEDEQERNIDFTLYEEDIFVGYRHFDHADLRVSYPFGYGLSYTTFELDELETEVQEDKIILQVKVTNTGDVAGKEVVQVYIGKGESAVERPEKELKAFAKTSALLPSTSQNLTFEISLSDLSYWDEDQSSWVVEPGDYFIQLGTSSRNILISSEIIIGEDGARVKPEIQ